MSGIAIAAADVDAIDAVCCAGCAEELRTGFETWSGYHECGLGRQNSTGGSPEYLARWTSVVGLLDVLFGWLP